MDIALVLWRIFRGLRNAQWWFSATLVVIGHSGSNTFYDNGDHQKDPHLPSIECRGNLSLLLAPGR
jgi:hypothetical protein